MAVKKTLNKQEVEVKKEEVVEVDVKVEEPVMEDEAIKEEENGAEPIVEITEVEVPEVKEDKDIVIDEKNTELNENKPKGNVKIRMRVDHKCCIAMERYDLKEGKTYVVPENVKRVLNKAGLLAPL